MNPPRYKQSLHQILIVFRSKPVLQYTRYHRVPFDTVYIDPFTRPIDITTMTSNSTSQSDSAPPTSQVNTIALQIMEIMDTIRSLNTRLEAVEARYGITTPAPQTQLQSVQPITQPAIQQSIQPITQQSTQSTTQQSTYLATQPEQLEQAKSEQEYRENTAEKKSSSSSDSKAITTKNTGLLSTIPRLAASLWFQHNSDHYNTYDAEDTTAI